MRNKAITYCRVSSKEQEETGYSLDAQEKLLKEYAEKKECEVTKVFRISESASGKQIRKTFNEMLAYMEKNHVPVLLCEKIDRLTRNLKDAATVSDWLQADPIREIHFVKENFVVNKNTRAHENLVWDMKVAIARFYTNNLSEEVKKGQAEKISQGGLPTKPPIGYKTIGEKGHKVHVLDPDKAPFVKRMFDLYATGNYSMTSLREELHTEGFRMRSGKKVMKSKFEQMLKDPFYYGALRWNDVIYHNGTHEPIISKETFDKVQDIRTKKKAPSYSRHSFQFRKMFKCGECGGSVTAEIQKNIVYYHCNHYRPCSQKKYTPEEKLEEKLFGVFKFFETITVEEAEEIKAKIKLNHCQEIEYKENTIKALNERYNTLQRRLDNLYNDKLDEKITREFWEKKQAEITNEQKAIQDQLSRLKGEEAKYFEIWLNILDLARRAGEIYKKRSPEERRLLLSHIFSNLVLKDETVTPTLKAPVQKLAERVQQRLDAEKTFEPDKNGSIKTQKGALAPLVSNYAPGEGIEPSTNRLRLPSHY
ncbi:MAG TPA: recombinase family protein [Candidatus Paceibacterota bacterium]|nr:recombinase family protein [Candidatus Paceibacterota bacterium]